MASTNPFIVLGLDPGTMQTLPDATMVSLITSAYRTLSQLYHPDRMGNEKRFKEIGEAYQELQDPERRLDILDRYEKSTRSRKAAEARKEKEVIERAWQRSEEVLRNFWMEISLGPPLGRLSALNLRPCRMLLFDTVVGVLKSDNIFSGSLVKDDKTGFELTITADGSLIRQAVERTPLTDGEPLPDLPREWIRNDSPQIFRRYYWKPVGQRETLEDIRLIGTADPAVVPGQTTTRTVRGMLAAAGPDSWVQPAESGFTWEDFRPMLTTMSPDFKPLRLLVAVQGLEQPRWRVLGRIQAIHLEP